jgi:UDP-N-acetylglucosamine 1-carboxyvinyltransferase
MKPMAQDKRYRIVGGHELKGTVRVAGAKNAVSKQLVASLLTDEACVIHDVPRIAEISAVLDMLHDIGTEYEWLDDSTLRLQTREVRTHVVPERYSGFNRIPILLLAPLLHRLGRGHVPAVGGCNIGARPVDFHLEGLQAMGAKIESTSDGFIASAKRIHGARITLPFPSVGATENLVILASLASGTTVIENAAVEPEIVDTILFLQRMGAIIAVETDRKIVIEGVSRLRGAVHRPVADRIEVASFAIAAVATRGHIKVDNAQQIHMISFLNSLRKVGGGFDVGDDGITFFRESSELRPTHLETDVHPGFMTDWQQPFVVLLTQAKGVSSVHETVYENRFGYTRTLCEMGAEIALTTACLGNKRCRYHQGNHLHSCTIQGPTKLHAREITIPDLRAGFGYLTAALVAEGTSLVDGIQYVERGYANVPEKIRAVGGTLDVLAGDASA